MLRLVRGSRQLYAKNNSEWKLLKLPRCCTTAASGVPYESSLKNKKDSISEPAAVPKEADVVIIGGGSIGCNTLYHLTKLGVTNAVLIEKERITSGTTWHTAGLVWRLRPSDVEIELLAHTRHLLRDVLEKETGINTGWIENGGLFIANNKERLDEYKRLFTLGKVYGTESHVLSPKESKELYPLMNVDDLYGCLFSPGDGTLDPTGFCSALTRAATRAGAKVVEKCPVTGIDLYEDDFGVHRVAGVRTPLGNIKTKCLVNCAGVWGPTVGRMAGVTVPLTAMKHAYVVTNRIEGVQNKPNIRDHDGSIYLKLQGDALSIGGYEPNPIFWEVKDDFGFGLFDLDWDVFGRHLEHAINRVPALEKTGIKSTVCGPESFTPDHRPIMGEDPFVRGFFHGCGFNSAGMMLGGGAGRELATWITKGRPELDMYGYDIRRFNPKILNNPVWLKERSHESYSRHYRIGYLHDEPLAARNMLKDPFHDELLMAGCVFQERLGWERAGWFSPDGPAPVLKYDYYGNYDIPAHKNYSYAERLSTDYSFDFPPHHDVIGRECLGCRENVAIFNMSYFGKFYLVGPDAQKAADWIFTNDMRKTEGATVYTCMLNNFGRVEADLTVSPITSGDGTSACDPKFEGERGFYVAAGGGSSFQNFAHILKVIQDKGFHAQLIDRSSDMGMISIQGPKSRELLQSLTDSDLSDSAFPFSTHQIIQIGKHKVRAMRLSFVGELGWELHIPNAACVPIYRLLMEKGKPLNIINAGYRAIDSLSIEKGYRHWHADLRLDDTPLEAGLGFTCKLKQNTPFLGREVLEKQQREGLHKRLACFTIDEHVPLWGLEAIFRDGEPVGFLRRADFAFALGRSIGYGYVSAGKQAVTNDYLKSGNYELERMGVRLKAQLHTRTPFDPTNLRVKGVYAKAA